MENTPNIGFGVGTLVTPPPDVGLAHGTLVTPSPNVGMGHGTLVTPSPNVGMGHGTLVTPSPNVGMGHGTLVSSSKNKQKNPKDNDDIGTGLGTGLGHGTLVTPSPNIGFGVGTLVTPSPNVGMGHGTCVTPPNRNVHLKRSQKSAFVPFSESKSITFAKTDSAQKPHGVKRRNKEGENGKEHHNKKIKTSHQKKNMVYRSKTTQDINANIKELQGYGVTVRWEVFLALIGAGNVYEKNKNIREKIKRHLDDYIQKTPKENHKMDAEWIFRAVMVGKKIPDFVHAFVNSIFYHMTQYPEGVYNVEKCLHINRTINGEIFIGLPVDPKNKMDLNIKKVDKVMQLLTKNNVVSPSAYRKKN
jgi:hypothetical protein